MESTDGPAKIPDSEGWWKALSGDMEGEVIEVYDLTPLNILVVWWHDFQKARRDGDAPECWSDSEWCGHYPVYRLDGEWVKIEEPINNNGDVNELHR